MNIGDKLIPFKLKGTDGEIHTSEDFASKDALVVIFTCNHCPYARAYVNRIAALKEEYSDQGVQIVAINPNDYIRYPEDSFEKMIPMAKELGVNGYYLLDETQDIAHRYDAKRTPEAFVFDRERKLVYQGAIDDNWERVTEVKQNYLNDAIEGVLRSQPIEVHETPPVGCSIKWKE